MRYIIVNLTTSNLLPGVGTTLWLVVDTVNNGALPTAIAYAEQQAKAQAIADALNA